MAVQHPEVAPAPRRPRLDPGDRCPWCEQPINHQKFVAITNRIAADERARAAVAQRRLREELAKQKVEIESRAAASVAEIEAATTAALAAADKAAKAKEAAARTAARKAAQEQITAANAAQKAAERHLADLRAEQERLLTKQLQDQRAGFDKALKAAIEAERERSFKDKQRLSTKVEVLQRAVDEQREATSGEGAAIDLVEVLKGAFPHDRIRPIGTGNQGANLIHEVVEQGRVCGVIVYDTRKRMAWRDGYVSRIRRDQLAAKADHAIIATQMLPAGASQVHLHGQVIVANPARVLVLVDMLRRQIVQMSTLRLSLEARADKSARLYEFISTDRFQQLLDEIDSGNLGLLQLDVEEQKAHTTTWRKRGQLVKEMQKAHGLIGSTIDDIMGAVGDGA